MIRIRFDVNARVFKTKSSQRNALGLRLAFIPLGLTSSHRDPLANKVGNGNVVTTGGLEVKQAFVTFWVQRLGTWSLGLGLVNIG